MTEATEGALEGVTEDTSADLVEAVETADLGDDAAAAETEGEEAQAPKPKKSAQDRIDELTRARREAERDAEYWKAKATQPQTEAQAAPVPEAPARPDPSEYQDGALDPQFIEDLTDWKTDQAVARSLQQRDAEGRTKTARQSFDERAARLYPDGEPAGLQAIRQMPTLPVAVQDVVLTSEDGPKLAEYLGSNIGELQRLSTLSPALQAYELAKIEIKLAAPKPAKTITDAPPATPQVRGSGGRFTVGADTDDFAAFEKQFGS